MTPRLTHFVCLSTQQQITNLLPALAVGATHVLVLSTSFTAAKGLDERLRTALGARVKVTFQRVPDAIERRPSELPPWLDAVVATWRGPSAVPVGVCWAGGQKPLAIGLFIFFKALAAREPDVGHVALYAEQHKGVMLVSTHNADAEVELAPKFTLDALLASHGIVRGPSRNLRRVGLGDPFSDLPWLSDAACLFDSQSFRALCFQTGASRSETSANGLTLQERHALITAAFRAVDPDAFQASLVASGPWRQGIGEAASLLADGLGARQRLSDRIGNHLVPTVLSQFRKAVLQVRPDQGVPVPDDERVRAWLSRIDGVSEWPGGRKEPCVAPDHRFPQFFEMVLAWRFHRWAMRHPHLVAEAYANFDVARLNTPDRVETEFDIIFATPRGKVIVLDAKSFDEKPGGQRAQESSVREVGGEFATRISVFPAYRADLDAPWFPPGLRARYGARDALAYDETPALEDWLQNVADRG